MAFPSTSIAQRVLSIASRITPDRRRHKRVELPLLGRFMRSNRQEFPCTLRDISVGGAAMNSPVDVDHGEKIIAYFDNIGGVEGDVVRSFEGGFAIRFNSTQHRREKLAAQLTWLVNQDKVDGLAERRHERIIPKKSSASLKLSDEEILNVQVLDVSISGASIAMQERPAIGTDVLLGKLRGRIVRHHEHGIGIQFLDMQAPTALRRYFG